MPTPMNIVVSVLKGVSSLFVCHERFADYHSMAASTYWESVVATDNIVLVPASTR
jgi:hypothetical protein